MKAQLKKVIVEVLKEDELIATTEVKSTAKGVVLSKGPTCECDIEEGDTILFSGYAGARFESEDGKECLVLQQEEVYAKL